MLTRPSRQRGFTLVEVLVTIAIGLLLAAVFVPALIGGLDRARANDSADSLAAIAAAIGSMHRDVGQFPSRISHLTTPITAGQANICGGTYGAAAAASWAGPYLNRTAPTTGLPLPIGVARDLFDRIDPPPATLLVIQIDDVSHADARALNARVDADADSLAGAVRWGPVADGVAVLSYVRPVRAC